MWLRAHLSTFAIGSVVLLTINLMQGSGGVWADTAIGAWGILILAHGILLLIARLLRELMADDDDLQPIRPASEMTWSPQSSWSLAPHSQDGPAPSNGPTVASGSPATMNPADAAEATAAARERGSKWPRGKRKADAEEPERVSWQAATDAAWLAPRPDGKPADKDEPDDDNDFTPLKFD